eukprot:CAMPEP_0172609764 /NCGR_PEP_ID=MMETSP1068-20121228/29678_1 /TAXON_ID=35684 /ORGANISM="Pseudopedinella elastica, Strain CCMP716" /LENGTH=531 /DNA_ID=CAMNT_0013413345 /DNA_START=45 /DNA_END=1640 /DNA_ORIENTATION=+
MAWGFFEPAIFCDHVLMRRVHKGELSFVFTMIGTMPILSTGAGMSVHVAKAASVVNLFFFIAQVDCVYTQIGMISISGSDEHDVLLQTLIVDIIVAVAFTIMLWSACVVSSESGRKYIGLFRAGRLADSVLNHILKNSVAGAACLIELGNREDGASDAAAARDKKVLEQLYRTMRWCASRQYLIDLADGSYNTSLNSVHLGDFFDSIVKEDGRVTITTAYDKNLKVKFDDRMALLAMENVVSNAYAHGDGESINISAVYEPAGTAASPSSIVFVVVNKVAQGSSVTTPMLRELHHSAKKTGFTTEMHAQAKAHHISTRSGLRHIELACQGAGAMFDLRIGEGASDEVVATLRFPAHSTPVLGSVNKDKTTKTLHATTHPRAIPSSLKICAIDDSKMICKGYNRILLPALGGVENESNVCCPQEPEAVQGFIDHVLGRPSGSPADVVIIDQHIELSSPQSTTVFGTDLASELRSNNFDGLVFIRSANSSKQDCEFYLSTGSVDGCLGKAESHKDIASNITRLYYENRKNRSP